MKYVVLGHTTVVVSIEVEASSEKEAYEKARRFFGGVHEFAGNGGEDKLIGVNGANETICADDPVEFDDVMQI